MRNLIFALIVCVPIIVLFCWLVTLIIRALRKYLRSDPLEEASEQAQNLGEALKARRAAAGYTQEYVAEALGVSRQAVSKWENGTSEPSTANLMALAKLYGVPVDELLTG